MAWSPDLIDLSNDVKVCITSSPVLARFDPSKLTFLKTNWSAEYMGYILMQPTTDDASTKAAILLQTGGPGLFDTNKSGARLQHIAFGSRCCTGLEKQYHSFVRKIACSRWSISQNRRFLWGAHFYWLCDCKVMKDILE